MNPISPTIVNFSRTTDCVSRLLHCLGCPFQLRGFVDALIGVGEGNWLEWVEISDKQLGWRIRTDQPEARRVSNGDLIRCIDDSEKILKGLKIKKRLTEDAVVKSVQRYRKRWVEWQKQIGIELIEVDPGGKKREKFFSTRYRFPIGAYLEEILALAEMEPDYLLSPDEVFDRVTRKQLLAEKLRTEGSTPRQDRFRRSRVTIESEMKRALTALSKTVHLCLVEDRDFARQVAFPMIDELENLTSKFKAVADDVVQLNAYRAMGRARK